MSVPFPPVPGVAREPLPLMTRRTLWERILDRFNPGPYKPAHQARKDTL